jgi:hypothetical protein
MLRKPRGTLDCGMHGALARWLDLSQETLPLRLKRVLMGRSDPKVGSFPNDLCETIELCVGGADDGHAQRVQRRHGVLHTQDVTC